MLGAVLVFVVLLWFVLAVSVAFHARGHDRSGILWFCVVVVSGIFGLAFYLLAVTSQGSSEDNYGREIDRAIVRHVPRILVTAVVGAVGALVVIFGFFWVLDSLTAAQTGSGPNSLNEFAEPLALVCTLAGLVGGPLVYYRSGWRRFVLLVSHGAVLLATAFVLDRLISVLPGLGSGVPGGDPVAFVLLVALGAGVVAAWSRVHERYVRSLGWADVAAAADDLPVDPSRRQTLAALGGTAAAGLVGVSYLTSRPTAENVGIEDIRTEYDSGDPVVVLTVSNPVSREVLVEVDVWIEDTFTNSAGERFTNSVSKTVERSLPPESETEVRVRFGDEKTDFGSGNPGIGEEFTVDEELTSVEPVQ